MVELDAKAVQDHRDLGVLTGREDHIHALLLGEVGAEHAPCRIGDELIAVKFFTGAEQCRIGRIPFWIARAEFNAREFIVGQT